MLNVVIIGASGYAGAELALLVHKHPELNLKGLYVSAGSQDANKPFSALHPQCLGLVDLPVKPLDDAGMQEADVGHVHGGHAAGVLRGQGRECAQAVDPVGGERLEVGLDAGPAAGIGAGDGQRAGGARVGHGEGSCRQSPMMPVRRRWRRPDAAAAAGSWRNRCRRRR